MELRWNGHKRMGSSPDLNEIPHEIPVARAPQAFPRHGYTFAYPELLLTSAQRVFVSHKSKYQLKLFVTTILAKLNVVQAEDARSRACHSSYERHVREKLALSPQESDMNRIHVALLRCASRTFVFGDALAGAPHKLHLRAVLGCFLGQCGPKGLACSWNSPVFSPGPVLADE